MIRPQFIIDYPSALCGQIEPDLWFPEKGGTSSPAKKICHSCIHESECLEDALSQPHQTGIRGGKSDRERKRIITDRKKALVAA